MANDISTMSQMFNASKGLLMIASIVDDTSKEIAERAKKNVEGNHSVDTGALHDSVKSEWKGSRSGKFEITVSANALSENGQAYGRFLEYGTGIYNEWGNGRQTPWKYKDRHGKWHTTHGMTHRPFIRPAIEETLSDYLPTHMRAAADFTPDDWRTT